MSDLKLIDRLQVLSQDTGEITEIFDIEIPIKQRIDGIGYMKKKIESRIELIKQRVKDLGSDRKSLEMLLDDIKTATIEGFLKDQEQMVTGLETKAYLQHRTKKRVINEDNIPIDKLKHSITIKNLTYEQKVDIYAHAWEHLGVKTADITMDAKVNIKDLPDGFIVEDSKTIVCFTNPGATVTDE